MSSSSLLSANLRPTIQSHQFNPFRQSEKNRNDQKNILPASVRFPQMSGGNISSNHRARRLIRFCSGNSLNPVPESEVAVVKGNVELEDRWNTEVRISDVPVYISRMPKISFQDHAFFLLAFVACTTSIAFTSLIIAAIPTLYAMQKAAISLSKLADTAREELPSTMAAIRLSGMEISDLTLELSDLSQEIADGVSKSAQAVQAAEAGIRRIGSLARQQTISMIQERASLPIISLQPVVAGAAMKTSHVVGQARKTFMNFISRGEFSLENEENEDGRVEK